MRYSRGELPEQILRAALANPQLRGKLRRNAFLPEWAWEELLSTQSGERESKYLWTNITATRARKLLGAAPNLELDAHPRFNVDEALTAWYGRKGIPTRYGKMVRDARMPMLSSLALRSSLPATMKEEIAASAWSRDRLVWLQQKEADPLPTERMWELANLPDVLPEEFEGAVLEENLQEDRITQMGALLYVRPELLEKALRSGDPEWLTAASYVPLHPAQQELLIIESEKWYEGEAAKRLNRLLSRASYVYCREQNLDPVGNCANAPWSSEAVWEHLRRRTPGSAQNWVEGEKLYRRNELGYSRHHLRRDREKRPNVELSNLTGEDAATWLEWAEWADGPTGPYVALELRKNRNLGPLRRQRLRALRGHSRAIFGVLRRYGYTGIDEVRSEWTPRLEIEKERTVQSCATVHADTQEAGWYSDGGMALLAAAGLTEIQLETALVLAEEFEGTLEQLIAAARQL